MCDVSNQTLCEFVCVCSVKNRSPFVGSHALPFIDQGGSRGYRWEKEENIKGIEGPLREPGLPFSLCLPCLTRQAVSEVACLLIFVDHALASFSKWLRPILRQRMVRRAGEPSCDPSGGNREVTIRPSL